ncbi:MAG: BRCT domain-containing protein [Kangiellaceae bacterium]|jgi:DNA ligase (NAD+)|nr:BRCT domain-containing protein [Kangiellaceae bacterium]
MPQISHFTSEQLAVIARADFNLSENELLELFNVSVEQLSEDRLVTLLSIANAAYRAGFPIITDTVYDHTYLSALQQLNPQHEFLYNVEPEQVAQGKTVNLPQKMLSTDKAYSFAEIKKWLERILKAADTLDISREQVDIRVTAKLDGYAAFDDGDVLYTRGDGVRGQDISRAFKRGLKVAGQNNRGLGAGEIVINRSYFEENLSDAFENSRNIQAAIIAEKNVEPIVQKAIDDGACVFFPFSALPNWQGNCQKLLEEFDSIVEQIWNSVDYDIDGVILEAVEPAIKQAMGATRHHHRWQIAFKVNDESAEVKVIKVTPQTSRTGRVSPVAELEPTKLSGATISRATVHHYAMVKSNGVGAGAVVQLVRSGLVIPKIEQVIQPVAPDIPDACPSCSSHLVWEGDHLVCPNKNDCPAQTENTLLHFFKTLGNNDGFGPKVIASLYEKGVKHIHEIYQLTVNDFVEFGFGEKTSENLQQQLSQSRNVAIEDWRFLAAFGVPRLGFGSSEKILEHHSIDEVFRLTSDDLVKIDGFAKLSADTIIEGLSLVKHEFDQLYKLGFNLISTVKISERNVDDNPFSGKQVVFTGSMISGSRSEMEKQAKSLGAKVAKSVSGNTDYLITGEKVGASKIQKAQEKGVSVISEAEYLSMLN